MKRYLAILAAASLLTALSLAGVAPFLQDDQNDEDPVPKALRSRSRKEREAHVAKKRQEGMARRVRYVSIHNKTNCPLEVRPYWIVKKEKVFSSTTLRIASSEVGRIDLRGVELRPPTKQQILLELMVITDPPSKVKPTTFRGTYVGPMFFDPNVQRTATYLATGTFEPIPEGQIAHAQNVPIIEAIPGDSGGG